MTDPEWVDELLDAIADTEWRLSIAKVGQDKVTVFAELVHRITRETRVVRLWRDTHDTPAARQSEIRRQLGIT
jgi:hypothetical protein